MLKNYIFDSRISFKAKGILAFILEHVDENMEVPAGECEKMLLESGIEGVDAIRNGIRELEAFGYIKRICERNEKGQFCNRRWKVVIPDDNDDSHNRKNSTGYSDKIIELPRKKEHQEQPQGEMRPLDCKNFTSVNLPIKGEDREGFNSNGVTAYSSAKKETTSCEVATLEKSKRGCNYNNTNNNITKYNYNLLEEEEQEPLKEEFQVFEKMTDISMRAELRKKVYRKWRYVWGFSQEMIIKAAELMLMLARVPNMAYIDKILYDWYVYGINNPEEAEQHIVNFRKAKKGQRKGKNYCSSPSSSSRSIINDYEIYVPPAVLEELSIKASTI